MKVMLNDGGILGEKTSIEIESYYTGRIFDLLMGDKTLTRKYSTEPIRVYYVCSGNELTCFFLIKQGDCPYGLQV